MTLILLALLACGANPGTTVGTTDGPSPTQPTGTQTGTTDQPPTGTLTDPTDTDTTDTDTTDTDPPTGPTGPTDTGTGYTPPTGIDCSYRPPPPLAYDTLEDWGEAEDFDFDGDGYHISVRNENLVRLDQAGDFGILATDVGSFTSGTRVMPDGQIIVANSGANEVLKIDPVTGSQLVLAAGVSYPNGVEVSRDGKWVFVAGNGAGIVGQIDAVTGVVNVVATGINGANGLVLSTTEDRLFVTTCSGEGVWVVPRIDETTWDVPTVLWHGTSPFMCIDGINVDACNNVYFTEYIAGKVRRIAGDGLSAAEVMVDLPSSWIPNMRWGVGVGGWDPDLLYVADRDQGRLFALHTLIPGKKHVLAP